MTGKFIHRPDDGKFEYHVSGSVAYAQYHIDGSRLFIDKVEAPQELRGTGAASALMQHIVDYSKNNNLQVIPVCSYAAAWMQRHMKPKGPRLG